MYKLKMIQKGKENYTGLFGQMNFKGGVSIEYANEMEARRIGSIVAIEIIDDEGNSYGRATATTRFEKVIKTTPHRSSAREVVEEFPREIVENDEAFIKAQEAKRLAESEQPAEEVPVVEADSEAQDSDVKIYSREELVAVADATGLKGLREIGEQVGARATSISALIEQILKAQQ